LDYYKQHEAWHLYRDFLNYILPSNTPFAVKELDLCLQCDLIAPPVQPAKVLGPKGHRYLEYE